jgi:hypothetical protein
MTNRQEYIENKIDHFERTFEFDSLARLKKLANEKGVIVNSRSKKAYIEALVTWYRQIVEKEVA